LDWTLIHAELRYHGLPPLKNGDEDVSPSLEQVHASMTAVLLELKRQRQRDRALQAAANEAMSRELAAERECKNQVKVLSREIEGLRNRLQKNEALVVQEKEKATALSVVVGAAEVELASLRSALSQLQRQLRVKVGLRL
jgi:chromosome segregation ATPase